MNRFLVALLIFAAGASTAVAIAASDNLDVAAVAGGVSVGAAGLLFAAFWRADTMSPAPAPAPAPPRDEFLFRFGFHSGRLGREEIVSTLDRIERLGSNPHLPGRSVREMSAIVDRSPSDFRAYVLQRVRDLERRS